MNNDPVELRFFSDAIIRRWYLPLGLAVIGALIGLQLRPASTATEYEAEARLLIRPVTDSVFDSNLRVDQIINEDTEAQLAASEVVARDALLLLGDEAPRDLGLDEIADGLDVNVRTDSQIVVVKFRHTDPDVAGAVTDAVAAAYLAARSSTAVEEKDRQAEQLATDISELTRDLTSANVTIATGELEARARSEIESRIARLEEIVAVQELNGEPPEAVGDPIGRLQAELAALPNTVDAVQIAAAETSVELISGQIANLRSELIALLTLEIDGGDVIQNAGVGEAVLPPNGLVYPAVGALAGLMVGIALAVVVERSVAARAASSLARGATQAPVQLQPERAPAEPPAPAPVPRHPDPVVVATRPAEAPAPEPAPLMVEEPVMTDEEVATWGLEPADIEDAAAPPAPAPTPAPAPAPAPTPAPASIADTASPAKPLVASGPAGARPTRAGTSAVASLADIPKIPRSAQEPVVITAPKSEPAIALRRVARLIQNETTTIDTPSVMITSAKAHEGRTTVATNIAAALRQEGLAVLLVTDSHERVIAPGVHVLPWGMRMGPDEEFPPTDRLRQLLVEARDLVDIVVIDGPPALGNADASRLASVVDRAILVAVNGRTSATDVATAKQQMESCGTKVLGLVTTARPSWLVRSVSDRSVAKR